MAKLPGLPTMGTIPWAEPSCHKPSNLGCALPVDLGHLGSREDIDREPWPRSGLIHRMSREDADGKVHPVFVRLIMTKILVIEDEKGVQDNVIDILQLEGFQVIFADNGLLGVLIARAEHPDLIICDIMMPELDGYGVLEQLRQEPDTSTIPFIFLTAKADNVDLRQGMESGADDYLTKPFTPQELRRAVAVRLEKQAAMLEKYHQERERAQRHQRESQERQNIIDIQKDFLRKMIVDLRDPLSNINIAIQLLANSQDEEGRTRYLKILREECAKEIVMLNQMAQLQDLMFPQNLKLLNQFKLIQ